MKMDRKLLLFFCFFLLIMLNSVASPLRATELNSDDESPDQSTKEVNSKMAHEQELQSSANDLRKENQALKDKMQQYSKLEEDLEDVMAKRVYEKARKRLFTMITLGGIVLTIAGIVGFKTIASYTKTVVTEKVKSVSEEQINKIVEEEGKNQVLIFVKEQQSKLEAMLLATAKQQIRQIAVASNPVRGEEKPTVSVEPGQPIFDLTSLMTPVRNQGSEGSTVGFAVAAALEYQIQKQLNEQVIISPRYIYYYAQLEAGRDPHSDTGAFVRDAIKVLRTKGAVSEDTWPYRPGDVKSDPPEELKTAKYYKISESYQVNGVEEVKSALRRYGPVVGGISVFSSTLAYRSGVISAPLPDEQLRGATAMCIVGYDDDRKVMKFKNSWGTQWGEEGYVYFSYDYVEKFLTDAWVFTLRAGDS
jgi:C1A family cysteine protease